MPFEVKLDADAMLKQLDDLQKNISGLDQELTQTFLDWQSDDMNRKHPSVEGGGLSVSTMIYPRSRLTRRRKNDGGKQARRRARVAAGRPGAKRPILRPELFDQLCKRMIDMLKGACTWQ